uniref:Uncharacterized protein n=1 Tax=Sipha flava TaxID=143950 RepID=A0A2S2RB39_9HEMI
MTTGEALWQAAEGGVRAGYNNNNNKTVTWPSPMPTVAERRFSNTNGSGRTHSIYNPQFAPFFSAFLLLPPATTPPSPYFLFRYRVGEPTPRTRPWKTALGPCTLAPARVGVVVIVAHEKLKNTPPPTLQQ